MRKFILFAAIAASAGLMTSCSQDDYLTSPPGVDANTIAFATRSNQVMTRSGETINSISKFTVSAVNEDNTTFFSNEEYRFDAGTGVFKSQTPYFWPTSSKLAFYAISNIGSYSTDDDNVPQYTYSNWTAEKDLVAATVKSGEKTIPYPLNFKHLTSQIHVSAEAEDKTDELTYKLISVKMTSPSTGKYSFDSTTGGTGTWEIDNTKTSEYSYDEALPMSFRQNGQIELTSLYWNILPFTEGKLYFKIEYQVLQNGRVVSDHAGQKYKECSIINPGLVAGRIYNYNFILPRGTDEEITFTLTMNDWSDGTSSNWLVQDQPALPEFRYDLPTRTASVVPKSSGKYMGAIRIPTTVEDGDVTYDVTSIDGAFSTCTELTSVEIPNSVKEIKSGSFWGCSGLTSIELPSSLTTIGATSFSGCYRLTSLTIPASVTSIGNSAFGTCYGLKSIVVERGNSKYDSRDNCNALIETSTNKLLAGCQNTVIPNTVTVIGSGAFWSCQNLESIEVPNSVTRIEDIAFVWCTGLTSVRIGSSVTFIGEKAFQSCSKLSTVRIEAETPPELQNINVFDYSVKQIQVPAGSVEAYKTADKWSNFADRIVAI